VNRRNAGRGLTGPGSDVRVDFYHVDSMDTLNYLPIYRHLPGATLICVPKPSWFDIERTEAILARERIVGRATPSPDARVVVATQYYDEIDRREYRSAVKVRLMYGIAEKLGNRNHSPYWSAPYDATLVPGEFSRKLIAAFSRAIVVGFPKYDAFFKGEYDRGALQHRFGLDPAKRTILYLPTWSYHSSLVPYGRAMVALFASLASEFNVVLKPHTVTVRHERERLEPFRGLIDAGRMILIEEQVNLADLFAVSGFALVDAQSGAFWETVLIGGLPVLGLCLPPDDERATLEARMPEVSLVSRGAAFLADDVRALLAGAGDLRGKASSVADELLAYRDGTAGRRAADVLLELAADGPHRSIYKSFHRLKVKAEAASHEHRAVRLALLALAPRELVRKVIDKLHDAARRGDVGSAGVLGFKRALLWIKAQTVAGVSMRAASGDTSSGAAGALGWLRAHARPDGGVRVHSGHEAGYQEVTGYLIPTLLAYGERDLARRAAAWLVNVQRPDGAFCDPDHGQPYVFDTGQALRGLLAALDLEPGTSAAVRAAADFLVGRMDADGAFPEAYSQLPYVPETIQLYVLPPLREAAARLGEERYAAAAERALKFYLRHPRLLDLDATLTHFLAYEIEALIDLGRGDAAAAALDRLAALQRGDGAVRAISNTRWVCAPGLAQIAVCWLKTGRPAPAESALGWMEAHQERSGGWRGGYGLGAWYFRDVEPAWVPKYYLDAHLLRLASYFDRNAEQFPDAVRPDDGRLQAIVAATHAGDRVLESGCGKGRFLAGLCAAIPDLLCTGVDLSEVLLSHLPAGVTRLRGTIENLPCAKDSFDVVFSVEAVEHSANAEAAVREMIRVARPGGRVLVVDKQRAHWGRLATPAWERWPDRAAVAAWLTAGCDDVRVEEVGYDGRPADGLMLVWSGVKRGEAR